MLRRLYSYEELYVEIVEFSTFVKFWSYDVNPDNTRTKRLYDRINVSAGVYLGVMDTIHDIDKKE
jgi:hypothetical protein